MAGAFAKITGRQRVEESLQASEVRYRMLNAGCELHLTKSIEVCAAGVTDVRAGRRGAGIRSGFSARLSPSQSFPGPRSVFLT